MKRVIFLATRRGAFSGSKAVSARGGRQCGVSADRRDADGGARGVMSQHGSRTHRETSRQSPAVSVICSAQEDPDAHAEEECNHEPVDAPGRPSQVEQRNQGQTEHTIRVNDSGSPNDVIVGGSSRRQHEESDGRPGGDRRSIRWRLPAEAVSSKLDAIRALPPVSVARFAVLAGSRSCGAWVIFGAAHVWSLVLIALSAGAGGCLRRWLGDIAAIC